MRVGGILFFLFVVVPVAIMIVVKCSGPTSHDDSSPVVSGGTVTNGTAEHASGSAQGVVEAGAPSAFDGMWGAALDPAAPDAHFAATLASRMSEDDYCQQFGCGDEFEREKAWADARKQAIIAKAAKWRIELSLAHGVFLPSDHLGEFEPKHNAIPVTMTWPYPCTQQTRCATHRPEVERLQAPNGEIANLWKDFTEPVYTAAFDNPEEARTWKDDGHERLVLRFVFKVADIAIDSMKETRAGVTLDSGAGALAIIRMLGTQLREGDDVLFERVEPSAKQGR